MLYYFLHSRINNEFTKEILSMHVSYNIYLIQLYKLLVLFLAIKKSHVKKKLGLMICFN